MDVEDRARFIGAIVAIRRRSGINEPEEFEIVDGQQRLVTIYLTVLSGAMVLAEIDRPDDAGVLARRYLFHTDVKGPNTKLFTSRIDSHAFAELWKNALKNEAFRKALGDVIPVPPATGGSKVQRSLIQAQFNRIKRWMQGIAKEEPSKINECVEVALSHLSMVYLELNDPTSAPTIFEGLNNGGVKTTVGDLVRNEVFSRLRANPDKAQAIFDGEWKDFIDSLNAEYNEFFFPYGLILDRQTKKGDLFSALRSKWGNNDVSVIISDMRSSRPIHGSAVGERRGSPSLAVNSLSL